MLKKIFWENIFHWNFFIDLGNLSIGQKWYREHRTEREPTTTTSLPCIVYFPVLQQILVDLAESPEGLGYFGGSTISLPGFRSKFTVFGLYRVLQVFFIISPNFRIFGLFDHPTVCLKHKPECWKSGSEGVFFAHGKWKCDNKNVKYWTCWKCCKY